MRQRGPNPLPIDQRLAVTVKHSAQALDCSIGKIWALVKKGKLKVADVDGMTRITGESLRALMSGERSDAKRDQTAA